MCSLIAGHLCQQLWSRSWSAVVAGEEGRREGAGRLGGWELGGGGWKGWPQLYLHIFCVFCCCFFSRMKAVMQ